MVTAVYSARPRNGEISTLQTLRIDAVDVGQAPDDGVGTVGPRVPEESRSGSADPVRTEGAPYPPADQPDWDRFVPNEDWFSYPPIPRGPQRGDLTPNNSLTTMRSFEEGPSQEAPPIDFDEYEEVDDVLPNLGDLGEVSVAENRDTIVLTGNTWMAFSEDSGATFTYINPTTLFPQDDGGLCCDQVVLHVPRYDLFVWLLQYRGVTAQRWHQRQSPPAGGGVDGRGAQLQRDRLDLLGLPEQRLQRQWRTGLQRYDGDGVHIYWISSIAGGRVAVRVPLTELAQRTTVNYRYTAGTNAAFSHITQNPNNQVYWAGHIDTSQLRVYNWPDGDNSYYWRSVNINSWPNDSRVLHYAGRVDWMQWESSITTYIYGNALQGSSMWLAWQAGRGGGFPHPHVQMVRLNASSFALQEQVQIWNPDFAFQDAFLSTNSGGEFGTGNELGISIGFGGPRSREPCGWRLGRFLVYYPTLSTRSVTRWGDYNTVRRSTSNPQRWVAGGYTLQSDGSGNDTTVPHYIAFGR